MSPVYEYRCPVCQLSCEILKPISKADEVEECPVCEKEIMIKKITSASFVINGSSSKNNFEG